MKVKIEFPKQSEKREDETGLSVAIHSKRGDTVVVDNSYVIPEGDFRELNITGAQMLVLRVPDNPKRDIVYDPVQKAAVERQNATPGTVPSTTELNMGNAQEEPPGPAGQPTTPNAPGGQTVIAGTDKLMPASSKDGTGDTRNIGDKATGMAGAPGQADGQAPAGGASDRSAIGNTTVNEPQAADAGGPQPGQNAPQRVNVPPMGIRPLNTTKPVESGEKDSAGNPVPKVDDRGPVSHAPPPNAPKKD